MRAVPVLLVSMMAIGLATSCRSGGPRTESPAPSSAEHALRLLEEGNRRFVESSAQHPHSSPAWRRTVAGGQHPFAIVLGCADSRVPVERVFDRGFGDLFVIRNAGNVAPGDVIASIDYATTHLNVPLVVVLGHEQCGAVAAALGPKAGRAGENADLQALLARIDPALEAFHVHGTDAAALREGIEANVRWTVARLREDVANGTFGGGKNVVIVGAIYDLQSGRIRFLDAT